MTATGDKAQDQKTTATPTAQDVLDFWFSEAVEKHWFEASTDLDNEIASRFADLQALAEKGALSDWTEKADTALALVILLDQFPRNLFRNSPRAFSCDALARGVSRHALEQGFDRQLPQKQRQFFYLPLMHSEHLPDQKDCIELYKQLENDVALDFAIQHHDIIERFGRFPHRNRVLGRESTPEEVEFLKTHSGF